MKRINLLRIIWIFATIEFKDVACVSYPGVYRNELPVIVPGASPIETVFVTERYGINYECIETCYPILNLCDDKCSVMPDLPECLQCQRLPDVQPTPIIIETPPYEPMSPYEPMPPSFERPVTPIVNYPLPVSRPTLIPKPSPPNIPRFPRPPRPILPDVPRPPPVYESVPPTPILPDIPQPPKVQPIKPDLPKLPVLPLVPVPPTEIPPQVTVPDVPHPNIFEVVPPELPSEPFLPHVPRPPQHEDRLPPPPKLPEPILPPLPNLPEPPKLIPVTPSLPAITLPPQPTLPTVPLTPQLEIELPPLPDMEIYSQLKPELPYVPMPSRYPEPPRKIPSVTVYEPPQNPVLQPVMPEIVRIPSPVSPEQTIFVTAYPENVVYPETMPIPSIVSEEIIRPPIVTAYRDICNDYCLQKRNTSECEICLKGSVPAGHLELCSNCLVNPSEPDCELCYPILFNLCREFCIFDENEPDCSMCYPCALSIVQLHQCHPIVEHVAPEWKS